MFKNLISHQFNLVRSFNSLTINSRPLVVIKHPSHRLFCKENGVNTTKKIESVQNVEDLPDSLETEISDFNKKNYLSSRMKSLLGVTVEEVKELLLNEQDLRKIPPNLVCNIITFLLEEGVSSKSIMDYPWLMLQTEKDLKAKLPIIRSMKPKKLDDFIPLAVVTIPELIKLNKIMDYQRSTVPNGNRIYYFSQRLKIPAHIVAKYFVKYPFMFTKSFESVEANLMVLLEDHQIQPIHILRDLRSFRYKPESNNKRLLRAKDAQKDKLMPWMTRCSEVTLQKCLQLSLEKRHILGENENVPEYLSQRLGYDMEVIDYMVKKHPLIVNVRMKKLKQALDFLLDEAKFTPTQIVQVPKILSHSLETTKKRFEELKSIDYVNTSLSNLCKSKREYQKVVDNWKEYQKKKKQRCDGS